MHRQINNENKKLIPLRRLAQEGSYSAAYFSILAQRKKLKVKKVGRNYFTTREWFNEYIETHAREEKRQQFQAKQQELPTFADQPAATAIPAAIKKEKEDIAADFAGAEEQKIKSRSYPREKVRTGSRLEQALQSEIIKSKSISDRIKPSNKLNQDWQNIFSSAKKSLAGDTGKRLKDQRLAIRIARQKQFNQIAAGIKNKLQSNLSNGIIKLTNIGRTTLRCLQTVGFFVARNLKASKRLLAFRLRRLLRSKRHPIPNWVLDALSGRAAKLTAVGLTALAVAVLLTCFAPTVSAGFAKAMNKICLEPITKAGQLVKYATPIVGRHARQLTFQADQYQQNVFNQIKQSKKKAADNLRLGRDKIYGLAAPVISPAVDYFKPTAGKIAAFGSDSGEKVSGLIQPIVAQGKELAQQSKQYLVKMIINATDQATTAAIKLENQIQHDYKTISGKLSLVKKQVAFIAGFWQDAYQNQITLITHADLAIKLIPDQIVQSAKDSATALGAFVSKQSESAKTLVWLMGKELKISSQIKGIMPKKSDKRGRVAGAREKASSIDLTKLLALANITAQRSKQTVTDAGYSAKNILQVSADKQKELSLNLGDGLAKLTLVSARQVGKVSQAGEKKLVQTTDKIKQTNQSIKNQGRSAKQYLISETAYSLGSLKDFYSKAIDFLIPSSLKSRYARMYQADDESAKTRKHESTKTRKHESTKTRKHESTKTQEASLREAEPLYVKHRLAEIIGPTVLIGDLDITGNNNVAGDLNVSGVASLRGRSELSGDLTVGGLTRFDRQIIVIGGADLIGGIYNSQGSVKVYDSLDVQMALTAKTLKVADWAEISGTLNVTDVLANDIRVRKNLVVVGNAEIQGSEIIYGNLNVKGTISSSHLTLASLGVSGLASARGLSAGDFGFSVSGDTYLSGENVYIASAVDLNNLLDIDVNSAVALTVGDGAADTFTVNTHNDIVTINARTAFSGDFDLDGALDLDVASSSALTVGDGTDDNLVIDTVSDIITIGYSSTTDRVVVNARQTTFNAASTTTGIVVNYDGTGNILQVVDSAVDRFIIADFGSIIQTASTTGYAYTLNQAAPTGNILAIQDQGIDRFVIADWGVTALTASSTQTALTVRQDDSGDILNLYDGANEVLTVLDGGNVGIGTSTPVAWLQVLGATEQLRLNYDQDNYVSFITNTDGALQITPTNQATTTISNALALTMPQAYFLNNGRIGFGTAGPSAHLEIASSTAPQLRLAYDTVNHTNFNIAADGALTLTTTNIATTTITNNLSVGAAVSTHGLGQTGDLMVSDNLEVDSIVYLDYHTYLGDATTTDITYFNSRIGTHLIPTIDNVSDIGSKDDWLRWRTGYFGTSVGIAGTATTTGTTLAFNGLGDITMGLASTLQTTSGGLTITSAEAATWSTTAGLLTLSGAGGITNTSTGGTYYVNAANQTIDLDSDIYTLDTTGAITMVAGAAFTASSTGAMVLKGDTFIASSTGVMAFWTNDQERLTIRTDGNVGIGTSSPLSKLSIQGTAGSSDIFTIASSTGANLLTVTKDGNLGIGTTGPSQALTLGGDNYHILLGGAGKFYIRDTNTYISEGNGLNIVSGSSRSINFDTGSSGVDVTIDNSGNVGIGTTSPDVLLHIGDNVAGHVSGAEDVMISGSLEVDGQCVTGDTLLPIINNQETITKKTSITNNQLLNIKYTRIDEVKGGEYVMSLNEKTGELAPARINALMYMGVKPTYKLSTESGRSIRTTGNHPYLTKQGWIKVADIIEKIANFGENVEIVVPNIEALDNQKTTPEKEMVSGRLTGASAGFVNLDYSITDENNLSSLCQGYGLQANINNPYMDVEMPGVEPGRPGLTNPTSQPATPTSNLLYQENQNISNNQKTTPEKEMAFDASTGASAGLINLDYSIAYQNNNYKNDYKKEYEDCKQAPQPRSTAGTMEPSHDVDIIWDKIVSIEFVGYEQVYDIEVEGTHNFVANGIIAHNTYLDGGSTLAGQTTLTNASTTLLTVSNDTWLATSGGNVGVGTSTPSELLDVYGDFRVGIAGSYDHLLFADTSNNLVGIGTSSPSATFAVNGLMYIGGTGTSTIENNLHVLDTLQIGTGSAYLTSSAINFSTTGLITSGSGAITLQPLAGQNLNLSVSGAGVLSITNTATTTMSGAFAVMSDKLVVQQTTGNVGIGTTDPQQKLHVEGQCVTGDTLLPIVREITNSKSQITNKSQIQNSNDQNNLDFVQIKNVEAGMEVMSLNEKTGELAPARINGLLDMGVKKIYEIETEDGKKIRTTGNHPYLVNIANLREYEANDATSFATSSATPFAKATDVKKAMDVKKATEVKNWDDLAAVRIIKQSNAEHDQSNNTSRDVNNNISHNNLFTMFHDPDEDNSGHNTCDNVSNNNIVHNSFDFNNITLSKNNPKENIEPEINTGIFTGPENPGTKKPATADANNILAKSAKNLETDSIWNLFNTGKRIYNHNNSYEFSNNQYSKDDYNLSNARWTKVAHLRVGQEIAEADDDLQGVKFVKIKRISILPPEQVYDIEVEGTHNFVANGIIAHNTYMNGNVGIGTATPGQKLHVEGQCVTDDTEITVVDEEDRQRNVQVKDIEPGMKVLSLNQKTGELTPAEVEALLDMGVKTVFELTTASGYKIRTTGNHPYLVKSQKSVKLKVEKLKAEENRLSANDPDFSFTNNNQFTAQNISSANSRDKSQNNIDNFAFFHLTNQNNYNSVALGNIKAKNISKTPVITQENPFILTSKFKNNFIISSDQPCFPDSGNIKTLLAQSQNNIPINAFISNKFKHKCLGGFNFKNFLFSQNTSGITQSGFGIGNSNAWILSWDVCDAISAAKKIKDVNNSNSCAFNTGFAKSDFLFNNNAGRGFSCSGNSFIHNSKFYNYDSNYSKSDGKLSNVINAHTTNCAHPNDGANNAEWVKVVYLEPGMDIAVADMEQGKMVWDKIVSIKELDKEHVYDLAIKDTHNFVANGIIAHNTYIQGNTGIGTSSPLALLSLQGTAGSSDIFAIASSTGANLLTVTKDGNVGIGTDSPGALLHLENTGTPVYRNIGILQLQKGGSPGLFLEDTDNSDAFAMTLNNNRLRIFIKDGSGDLESGDEAMVILDNGNVGIGTTSPDATLHIESNLGDLLILNQDTSGAPDIVFQAQGTEVAEIRSVSDGQLAFETNQSETMRLDSTGNVGIGTTSPEYQMHLWGTAQSTDANNVQTGSQFGIEATVDNVGMYYRQKGNFAGISGVAYPQQLIFRGGNAHEIYSAGNIPLVFGNDATERMRINTGGNVGIGTTSPDVLLHVGDNVTGHLSAVSESLMVSGGLEVDGQCVTGDTLLPIVREITNSKSQITNKSQIQNSNDQNNLDFVQIKNVEAGMEVMSLNEKTGELAPAKIKGLMDMGKKVIYEIETEDGKKIRTTGNHPYLVNNISLQKQRPKSPVINTSPMFNFSKQDAVISQTKNSPIIADLIAVEFASGSNKMFGRAQRIGTRTVFSNFFDDSFLDINRKPIELPMSLFSEVVDNHNSYRFNLANTFLPEILPEAIESSISSKNAGLDVSISSNKSSQASKSKKYPLVAPLLSTNFATPVSVCLISGLSDENEIILSRVNVLNINLNNLDNKLSNNNYSKNSDELSNVISAHTTNCAHPNDGANNANSWIKVHKLQEGDEIAVVDDDFAGIKFVKIKKIKILKKEQVYDIEVEGTHNFVANGIIAHNTYLDGGSTLAGQTTLTNASTTLLTVSNDAWLATSGGNVGIGTVVPDVLLHTYKGASGFTSSYNSRTSAVFENSQPEGSVISIMSPSTGYSGIFFGDESSESIGQFKFDHITNNFEFYNTDGTKMVIQSNGKVGIGTTSPKSLLNLYSSTGDALISFGDDQSNLAHWFAGTDYDDSNKFKIATTSTQLGVAELTITKSGNVGIGTTSPTSKFSIAGNPTDSVKFFHDNDDVGDTTDGQSVYIYRKALEGDRYFRFYVDQYNVGHLKQNGWFSIDSTLLRLQYDADGDMSVFEHSASGENRNIQQHGWITAAGTRKYIQWQVNDTTDNFELTRQDSNIGYFDIQMPVIMTGGNVGIGSSSPLALLSLQGTAGSSDIFAIASSTGANLLTVTKDGNVGIGTTSPGAKLHVAGHFLIDNVKAHYTKDWNGNLFRTMVAGSEGNEILWLGEIDNVVGIDKIYIMAGGSEAITILNDGNVGIGTTEPISLLDISGTSENLTITDTKTSSFDLGYDFGGLNFYGSSSYGDGARVGAYIRAQHLRTGTGHSAGDMGLAFGISGLSSSPVYQTAYTAMVIDNSGNIGIGTTGPEALLHVVVPDLGGEAADQTALILGNNDFVAGMTTSLIWQVDTAGASKRNSSAIKVKQIDANSASMHFYLDEVGLQERVTILNTGNVGIGTTSPDTMLEVYSASDNTAKVRATYGATTVIEMLAHSGGGYIQTIGASPIKFAPNGAAKMIILGDGSGNVGIGTASPGAKLDVEGGNILVDDNLGLHWGTPNTGRAKIQGFSASPDRGLRYYARGNSVGWFGVHDFYTEYNDGSDVLTMRLKNGNVGIGTTGPTSKLEVAVTDAANAAGIYIDSEESTAGQVVFAIETDATVADALKFKITADGSTYSDINSTDFSGAADYAEYYITRDTDLQAGEAVCIDITMENAVERCRRPSDSNVMGIISTNPAIVGNTPDSVLGLGLDGEQEDDNHYAIVAMLGQIPAKVSLENGEIRPGDSLTPASIPGYIMRANAGDPTVGVALSALGGSASGGEAETGMINVLISRRNKSLTVETVEEQITDRIADMEIEDEVQLLIAAAVDNLNLDPKIAAIAQDEAGKLDSILTVSINNVSGEVLDIKTQVIESVNNINNLNTQTSTLRSLALQNDSQISVLGSGVYITNSEGQAVFSRSRDINALVNRDMTFTAATIVLDGNVGIGTPAPQFKLDVAGSINSTELCLNGNCKSAWSEIAPETAALTENISVDEYGNIKMGDVRRGSASTEEAEPLRTVAIVEIVTATTTEQTALVVNQQGYGDIADFQASDVSVMNIADSGKVTVVGELLVDGRIMACSGGSCGSILDAAVDETMGDIGVEGKVVAGAFEGYCDDGFVWVPGSAKYGTLPGFCVQSSLTPNPSPTPVVAGEGSYWTNISQGEAMLACQSLGDEYHLISENEWLTIAENVIRVAENDIDDVQDGLQLAVGTQNFVSLQTEYVLTNDNIIYDLAGPPSQSYGEASVIAEWTDQTVTMAGCPGLAGIDEWQEYYDVIDYKGMNIAPAYYLSDKDNNIGRIKVGDSDDNLRGFVRGYNGIYSLDLSNSPATATSSIGFRCAR